MTQVIHLLEGDSNRHEMCPVSPARPHRGENLPPPIIPRGTVPQMVLNGLKVCRQLTSRSDADQFGQRRKHLCHIVSAVAPPKSKVNPRGPQKSRRNLGIECDHSVFGTHEVFQGINVLIHKLSHPTPCASRYGEAGLYVRRQRQPGGQT